MEVPKKKTSLRIKRSFLNKKHKAVTNCVRELQLVEIIPGIIVPGLRFSPSRDIDVDLLVLALR